MLYSSQEMNEAQMSFDFTSGLMSRFFPKPKPAYLADYLVHSNSNNIKYVIYFSYLACVVFGIQLLNHFRLGDEMLSAANLPYTLLYSFCLIIATLNILILGKLKSLSKLWTFVSFIEALFSIFLACVAVFWSILSINDGHGITPYAILMILLCFPLQGQLKLLLGVISMAFIGLTFGLIRYADIDNIWPGIVSGFTITVACFVVANLIERIRLENFEMISKLSSTNKQLHRLSRQDHLTKLLNRRAIDKALNREVTRCERFEHPLSLLMIDVDDFKQINDGFGHVFGDKVLVDISQCIKKHIRDVDFVGRMGGDEFLVILIETNHDNALQIADRMRNEVMNLNKQYKDCRVSISVGLTVAQGESVVALLEKADKALYLAKKAGKNKVRNIFSQYEKPSIS